MAVRLDVFRGEQGQAFARDVLSDLAERAAPTSPANYEIWAMHRAGAMPELSHEINQRLARGEPFNDEVSEDLFERHFAKRRLSDQMVEASAGIASELSDVASILKATGAHSGAYASGLQAAAGELEHGVEPAALRSIVGRLAAATREMAERSQLLEQRVEASSRQLDALQLSLNHALSEALSDGLTGLANRKHFDEAMAALTSAADQDGSELALLLFDIDHFKQVNDRWGHQVGDQVIRYVAGVLRAHAGAKHVVARYGGEEFAMIAPKLDLMSAVGLAERIRSAIAGRRLSRRSTGETIGNITISIGAAAFRWGESAHAFLERADSLLYESKHNGRNRVSSDLNLENAA